MFNWFWEFLYGLVKSLFQLADVMIYGSRKLCGVDKIVVKGEETDLLSYLFRSSEVSTTFKIAALSGIIVVMFFAVIAIIRSVVNHKKETTPAHVLAETAKTLLIFLFVPTVMLAFMWICNEFIVVINASITGSSEATLGSFLFTACADGAWYGEASDDFINGVANYANAGEVAEYISLSDFNYMLGFIAGLAILFPIASMLIMFVDRTISIVLLFIVSPYSISSNVLDDGSHFKLWRDQVLIKFFTGYGCIIALNIYALVIKLVIKDDVVFFPVGGEQYLPIVSNALLNDLMKLAIMVGGAFSLRKIMPLIGNLIQAGAGSNEFRDMAFAEADMNRYVGGLGRGVRGLIGGTARLGGAALKGRGNFGSARRSSRGGKDYGRDSMDSERSSISSRSSIDENENINRFSELPNYKPAETVSGGKALEGIISVGGSNNNYVENNIRPDDDRKDVVSNTILNSSSTQSRPSSALDDIGEDEDLK